MVKTKKINLIVSGGGCTGGFYGIGVLHYFKELEKNNKVKIVSISGCSVGSLLGLHYLNNSLNDLEFKMRKCIKIYRKTKNFDHIKNIIFKDYKNIKLENINNKLIIHYIKNNKLVKISNFKSVEEILKHTYKSCFIPFMFQDKFSYHKCVDCVKPDIFLDYNNKKYKTIYLRLKMNSLFKRNTNNINFIINDGYMDSYKFINSNNKLDSISYIYQWNFFHIFLYRIVNLYIVILYTIFYYCKKYKYYKLLPNCFLNNLKNIYKDIIILYAFS